MRSREEILNEVDKDKHDYHVSISDDGVIKALQPPISPSLIRAMLEVMLDIREHLHTVHTQAEYRIAEREADLITERLLAVKGGTFTPPANDDNE